jgi:RNA polymerase sigma-70 factor (ECF subfamily)
VPEQHPPGREEDFTELCQQYRARLVRWATSVFGRLDAEDIAQEALLRLYKRPDLYQAMPDPWPWLSVVARNFGRDNARRAARSCTLPPEVLNDLAHAVEDQDRLIAGHDAGLARQAWESLRTQDRNVLALRDLQGLPVRDIAGLLDLKENAVNQRVWRARRRLETAFLALEDEQPKAMVRPLNADRPRAPGPPQRQATKPVTCICGRAGCRSRSQPAALRRAAGDLAR